MSELYPAMLTVISVYAFRMIRDQQTLEEIQEFCRQYNGMLSGWIPESLYDVRCYAQSYISATGETLET